MNLINNFVNNVLILDDQEQEIKVLKQKLEKLDIKVDYYSKPEKLLRKKQIHPKDLLILDFRLFDDINSFPTIMSSFVRPILKKHFNKTHPYGIVIWSKHDEDYMEKFYEILKTDTITRKEYDTPLFIINLDKGAYLSGKKKYETIIKDIDAELERSVTSSFFINWNESVKLALYQSIIDIYRLSGEYKHYNSNIIEILYKIAINKTGIPAKELNKGYRLDKDAFKSMNELLYSDIVNIQSKNNVKDIFKNYTPRNLTEKENTLITAELNTKLFFDSTNLSYKTIFPGNIYKTDRKDPPFFTKDQIKMLFKNSLNKPNSDKIDNDNISITNLMIELTPPCDFCNKKIYSRFVCGMQIDIKKEAFSTIYQKIKGRNFQNCQNLYVIVPLALIEDCYSLIIFDFRNLNMIPDNEVIRNYTVYLKARDHLFADILQKFSAHASRLGLNMLK